MGFQLRSAAQSSGPGATRAPAAKCVEPSSWRGSRESFQRFIAASRSMIPALSIAPGRLAIATRRAGLHAPVPSQLPAGVLLCGPWGGLEPRQLHLRARSIGLARGPYVIHRCCFPRSAPLAAAEQRLHNQLLQAAGAVDDQSSRGARTRERRRRLLEGPARASPTVAMVQVMLDIQDSPWPSVLCTGLFTFAIARPRHVTMLVFHNTGRAPECFPGSSGFFEARGVLFRPLSYAELEQRLRNIDVNASGWPRRLASKKLCDTRPLWGLLFREELRDYSWWGYGDVDGLFGGGVRRLFSPTLLSRYDVLSGYCREGRLTPEGAVASGGSLRFEHHGSATEVELLRRSLLANRTRTQCRRRSSGALQLFRNSDRLRDLVRKWLPAWRPFLAGRKQMMEEYLGRHGIEQLLRAEPNLTQFGFGEDGEDVLPHTTVASLSLFRQDTQGRTLTVRWSRHDGLRINDDLHHRVWFVHWLQLKGSLGKGLDAVRRRMPAVQQFDLVCREESCAVEGIRGGPEAGVV